MTPADTVRLAEIRRNYGTYGETDRGLGSALAVGSFTTRPSV